MTSGASATNSRRIFPNVVGVARAPADIDPRVAADDPGEFLQPLQERCVVQPAQDWDGYNDTGPLNGLT
jgi:hypothetical protein